MKTTLLIIFIGLQVLAFAQVKVTELQNLDILTEEQFGSSIAITDEYLAVGAFYGNSEQGAAYIYKFENEEWLLSQKLVSNNPQDMDWFGTSTSLNKDYLAIGAATDHWAVDRVGKIHIYELVNDEWAASQVLTEDMEFSNSAYGSTLDNTSDALVVGAPAFDDNTGCAVIYENNNGTWEKAKILHSRDNLNQHKSYGGAVSVYNDWVAVAGITRTNLISSKYFVDLYQDVNGEWVFQQQIDLPFETNFYSTPFNNIELSENGLFIGGYMGRFDADAVGGIYEYIYNGTNWILKNDFSVNGYEQNELGFRAAQSNNFMITGAFKSESNDEKHHALIYDNRGDKAEQIFEFTFPLERYQFMRFSMSDSWGAASYTHNLNEDGSVFLFDLRELTTEVKEESISQLNIFPNPVTEILNIESGKAQEISIMNALGELVISKRQLSVGSNKIDVSDLDVGMYFLKITEDEEPTVLEFLKN